MLFNVILFENKTLVIWNYMVIWYYFVKIVFVNCLVTSMQALMEEIRFKPIYSFQERLEQILKKD